MRLTRNYLLTTLFALVLGPSLSYGQGRSSIQDQAVNTQDKTDQLGVGLQAGSLSGVNFQYWFRADRTLNAALIAEKGNLALSASHNWVFRDTFGGQFRDFIPFVGAGLVGAWGDRSAYFKRDKNENYVMALQAPVGIEFLPRTQRFSVFAEVAPGIQVVPQSFAFVMGDVGARFYF